MYVVLDHLAQYRGLVGFKAHNELMNRCGELTMYGRMAYEDTPRKEISRFSDRPPLKSEHETENSRRSACGLPRMVDG